MTTSKELWALTEQVDSNDCYTTLILRHKFLASQTGEAITEALNLTLSNVSELDVATSVANFLKNGVITGDTAGFYEVLGSINDSEAFCFVSSNERSTPASNFSSNGEDDEEIGKARQTRRISIQATSNRVAIEAIFNHLKATFKEAKLSTIKWWFNEDGRVNNKEIYLDSPTTTLHKEYYPGLGDPIEYIRGYLSSEQSILLMAGPPGTGKTTLLRHMICDFSLKTEVIYDEKLMENDSIFQNFLFGNSDIMIIEDADSILTSRADDNNKLMARFLNVSDGLIKLPNKKLVFTTNISDFGRVDPALIRPGRCFDVVHTRALTYNEAKFAASVAKLPVPMEPREYTLAELFNQQQKHEVRKVGFR